MALLYNPIHIAPAAVPAINPKPIKGTTIFSLLWAHHFSFFAVKSTSARQGATTPPQKYVYPDPIPEFAAAETQKFKAELLNKLSKEKDTFGNDLQTVVNVCAEVFSDFLLKEYGGPGTLLIEPFTDMMITLKEKNLPGAPLAARASLLWAQNYVDQDWENWNSKSQK